MKVARTDNKRVATIAVYPKNHKMCGKKCLFKSEDGRRCALYVSTLKKAKSGRSFRLAECLDPHERVAVLAKREEATVAQKSAKESFHDFLRMLLEI